VTDALGVRTRMVPARRVTDEKSIDATAMALDGSPKQVLELSVFGGKRMIECRREFPRPWHARAS
jgi:hypothetical protein